MVATDTCLTRLAGFARDLTLADVPNTVVQRVRLQHLGFAAVLRQVAALPIARQLAAAGGRRGRARLVTGGSAPGRDAARLHGALGAGLGWGDHLFAGHTGAGALGASWALAKGHSVDELFCATVAANEVAGRLGAALLIGPDRGEALGQVHALAAATAAGWLEGLDRRTLANAMALAVTGAAGIPFGVLAGEQSGAALAIGAAVQHGFDAVQMAKKGVEGPLDAIEAPGGVLDSGCWLPLRAAFTGLGQAWLSETLAYKLLPAADTLQAPLQAVQIVLERHVKAADKRLRPDQVLEIEVKLGAPGWNAVQQASMRGRREAIALPYDLHRAIGALVVSHELDARQLGADWWASHGQAAAKVASRVRVVHDWHQTMDVTRGLVAVFAPLLAGVTFPELRAVSRRAIETHGRLPRAGLGDLVTIVKSRPDQLMEQIRYASGNLSDARLDEWQLRFGAKIRIATTRGGSWPGVQEIAKASPGWSWGETRSLVLAQHGGDGQSDNEASQELLDVENGADASDWLDRLLD